MVLIPGPVKLLDSGGSLSPGEQRTPVGVGTEGSQHRPGAAGKDVGRLGYHVDVLALAAAYAEGNALEAGDARIAGRRRFGDVDACGDVRSIAGDAGELKEQPVPAGPQRPVAARLAGSLDHRAQGVECLLEAAAGRGEPAAHHGEPRAADFVVGVSLVPRAPQQVRRGLGLSAEQGNGNADDQGVQGVHAGAELTAQLDQRARARVGVVKAPEREILPHLGVAQGREDLIRAAVVGPGLVQQHLGVTVPVQELQGRYLIGEAGHPGERAELTEVPQRLFVARFVPGRLASRLKSQGE